MDEAKSRRREEMKRRTRRVALAIIRLGSFLPRNMVSHILGRQLLGAGTSVGAHYREACRAKSRADFINKLGGAIEEVDESALWLEILAESGISAREQTVPLWREADELTRIFVRSRETARANRDAAIRK